MSEAQVATPAKTATVYFIDDSATMREVIKIAFKKENILVVTCPSVSAAIEQFGQTRPDVVISDVIMPDRDGYELCTYVKQHADLGATPVILMSGVVNRTVAEKATVVRADELLRKPFQPHELVARVKKLLRLEVPAEPQAASADPAPSTGGSAGAPSPANGRAGLGDLFAAPLAGSPPVAPPAAVAPAGPAQQALPAKPFVARADAPAPAPPRPAAAPGPRPPAASAPAVPVRAPQNGDAQRLRFEIQRLELLVKKLQSELEAERQYCQALEAHIRALQGAE